MFGHLHCNTCHLAETYMLPEMFLASMFAENYLSHVRLYKKCYQHLMPQKLTLIALMSICMSLALYA